MRCTRHIPYLIALLFLANVASPVWAKSLPQTVQTPDVGVDNASGIDGRLTNPQGWYTSILTQHQIISEKIEETREKLHQDLLGTQEFLDEVSELFERTDRLYRKWKELDTPCANQAPDEQAIGPESAGDPPEREDAAVGKSLNYLRLSLINFFLGYCDSNGKQIDDAEKQARLSKLWRTRSQLFVKTLDS